MLRYLPSGDIFYPVLEVLVEVPVLVEVVVPGIVAPEAEEVDGVASVRDAAADK